MTATLLLALIQLQQIGWRNVMTDKVVLNGPLELKNNSEARVAYELMVLIANKEVGFTMAQNKNVADEQKSRDYWLKLYSQCHSVARGNEHVPQEN